MRCRKCKTTMEPTRKPTFYPAEGGVNELENEVNKCPKCGAEKQPEDKTWLRKKRQISRR